ncbi:TPA: hypothetical protein HA278_06360 [Candidatus Woesearchaeota archaeon]|nr:hypothetical protein [Candidatus Woesearchaeota archaeon]|tara:strand:+ start:951 stop:1337 length:387 start_codon:yes stop_codon:yes gene_type:complete
MNPDFPKHNTAESTSWTITNGSITITFKVVCENGSVIINGDGMVSKKYDIKLARKIWNDYMKRSFRVVNKCVDHNMKKFHSVCRKYGSIYRKSKAISFKDIHDEELKEMRIDPYDFYKKVKNNYALEA